MRNALSQVIQKPLPATLIFDYPTVERLSRYLRGELSVTVSADDRLPRHANALGEVEALSDEEVELLYAQKVLRTHAKSN
jgi:hypothetical protein